MKTLTKIIGVQSKIGQNSKIGSNVTIQVSDNQVIDLQQYYLSVRAGETPHGKLKKVELHLIYEEDLNLEIKLPDTSELDNVLGNDNKGLFSKIDL